MEQEAFGMIWWVLFLPLIGSVIQALFGGFVVGRLGPAKGKRVMGMIAVLVIAAAFAIGASLTFQLAQLPDSGRVLPPLALFDWIDVFGLKVPFEVVVDPLSMTMVLVITGVGALIHLYATGYMAEERDYTRFFTYLNLFISAMLILVLGANLPLMFIGWEGVGLCSYLLIAFWYKDITNAKCGNKAFIVNRIGDWGLMLGMFLLACVLCGEFLNKPINGEQRWLSYDVILPTIGHVLSDKPVIALAIALLLFVGACGKSAQFPLYFWLPDAMAGPTPVSALIHAATMVTAGVFMLNRLAPVFLASPAAMGVVAVVGAFTALFAALVAFGQTDIKKVLAYSTVSQLGFMFVACGMGAFWAGMFHVVTHAFFKALLFLGSGAVIAAMAHEQDMRRYGNLMKYVKITAWTMVIGWLAIAGVSIPFVFGLAGFYSKEAIIGSAIHTSQATFFGWNVAPALGWVLLGVALLTSMYMTRLMMLTFFGGQERWRELAPALGGHFLAHQPDPSDQTDLSRGAAHPHHLHPDIHGFFFTEEELAAREEHEHHHGLDANHTPKEVYPSMWVPLVVLALLSVVGGFVLNPYLQAWLNPGMFAHAEEHEGFPTHTALILLSTAAALLGIVYGYLVYRKGLPKSEGDEKTWHPFRKAAGAQFGYDGTVVSAGVDGGGTIANWIWRKIDMSVIDGFYNGLGWLTTQFGYVLRLAQSGYVRTYALMMLLGAAALLGSFWYAISRIGGQP